MRKSTLSFIAAFVFSMATAAFADVTFSVSSTLPTITPNEVAVLIPGEQHGSTVNGTLAGTDIQVLFSTPDELDTLKTLTGGFIKADDVSINTLTVTVPGFGFGDIIADVRGVFDGHPILWVTVVLNDGTVSHMFTLDEGATTPNYIFIEAINGEVITSVTFGSPDPGKFNQLDSVYISGVNTNNNVPEPTSMALLATGLGAVGAGFRKRLLAG